MTRQLIKSLSYGLTISSADASEMLVSWVNEYFVWC